VGEPFNDANWTYDGLEVDQIKYGWAVDCAEDWLTAHLLCDPSPNKNARGIITQDSEDVGYTSDMSAQDSVSFIVVDLGQISTFYSLEVYQMWGADGNVSHAQMFVSPTLTDTWPVQSDPSWVSVAGGIGNDAGVVELGVTQGGTAPLLTNSAVTVFDFPEVTGRYVMFYFANDGRYADDDYIEVAGVKLFGSAVTQTSPTPTPTPTPTPSILAETGAEVEWLALVAVVAGTVVAGVGLVALGRRKLTE
jgi:hypothetical protein